MADSLLSHPPSIRRERQRERWLLCLVPLCLTALVGLVLFFLAPALEVLLLPVVAR